MTVTSRAARLIAGSTDLPPGYHHPHASEEARALAQAGMIVRVQVGSGVHGTAVSGQDDRDEMGVCPEPWQFVVRRRRPRCDHLLRAEIGAAGTGRESDCAAAPIRSG